MNMGGNSFGQLFRITTFGESHGTGIGVVIDGCPSGIPLDPSDFHKELSRRKPSTTVPGSTPRSEKDRVLILSGVFEGLTTGAPIGLFVKNQDAMSNSYDLLRSVFRPGHGDYTYFKKYEHYDFRGGGRYSARETVARVAAGVVAGKILAPAGIIISSYTIAIGSVRAGKIDPEFAKTNDLYCPDPDMLEDMKQEIIDAKQTGDSIGGVVETLVTGCPPGLGEPVFDKLDADLAKAVMSIGTIKGLEIGAGFRASEMKGSRNNDPIFPDGFGSNNAGGILAGISNGDTIVLRCAIKPIPSIRKPQHTITRDGGPDVIEFSGRVDVCAIPRIVPVIEAMVKLVLCDHYLRFRAMSPVRIIREAM